MSKSLNTKKQIIEASKKLFIQYGYKKVSMQDIANYLHKTKGSLYYYFKNKEEIFFALIEEDTQNLKRILYEAIKKENTAEDKLRSYIITRQKGYQRLSRIYETLHNDIYMDNNLAENIRSIYEKEEVSTIKMILRKGIKQNLFNTDINIDIASKAIFSAIKGFGIIWDINRAEKEEDRKDREIIDALLNILFYGIKKR